MEHKNLAEAVALVTRKFYKLNEKARKSDLCTALTEFAQEGNIYSVEKNNRDIFYYGMSLCVSGITSERLDKILSNLINHEKDKEKRKYCLIQKEAVMCFYNGSHLKLFLSSLFSYLSIDELKEVQKFLFGSPSAQELSSLLEKPCAKIMNIDNAPENYTDNTTLPFVSFNDIDKDALLAQLKNENPLTIAYILSIIEPQKAADILCGLSTGAQIDTAYKIALMDNPDIELLYDLLRLEKKYLSQTGREYKTPGSDEFEKLLRLYLVREDAVNEAVDLYKKLSQFKTGSKEAGEFTNKLLYAIQGKASDFFKTNPGAFLKLLEEEHPKTVSLILSALEPQKAAFLLQFLSSRLQCDAGRRIALMDKSGIITDEIRNGVSEISEDEIRRIEKSLSSVLNGNYVLEGGIKKLSDLLLLSERYTQKTIMEFIEKTYPEFMDKIDDCFFCFEDIVMLHDIAIQKVLRWTERSDLAAALKFTSDAVKQKVLNNLSKRAAIMLKEDIECFNSANMEKCENAKKKVVSVIRHLEETGEIIIADND